MPREYSEEALVFLAFMAIAAAIAADPSGNCQKPFMHLDQMEYSALDLTAPLNPTIGRQQQNVFLKIPPGWSLADDNDDSRQVLWAAWCGC